MKKLLQKIFYIIDPPERPKKTKKLSPFWKKFRRKINTAFNIANIGFKVGILVFSIFFWIVLLVSYRNGYYFSFLEESSTLLFLMFIPVAWLSIIMWAISEKPNSMRYIYENLIAPNRFYKLASGWIFKISKSFFEKIVFPNIEIIEPGVTGQLTEGFPDVIIFSDEQNRTPEHIKSVTQRLISVFTLLFVAFFVSLCFLLLPMVLLPRVMQDVLAAILLVILIFSTITMFLVLYHPASLITRRRQAFLKEYRKIEEEEWLQSRIEGVKKDSKVSIDDYSLRLNEIKSIFYQELKKLGDVNEKIVITQELVERTRSLVKNNEDPIRLLLKENQDLQEEKEKKKYWKDKMVDAAIGFIVGVVTTIILTSY